MQTFKDKQQQLFKWDHLPEKTLLWLDANWPGVWRREIIPMIDERMFSGLYCADDGRASKATADMIGIVILKELNDLTDKETARSVMLDTGWQYALDLAPTEAYVAERTIQYFRAALLANAGHASLMSDLADKIIATLKTATGEQREDSSHLLSNMKILTRLELFVKTITVFLRQLRKEYSGVYDALDEELRRRYLERETGRFADARGSESRRRVQQCAADAWLLLEMFSENKTIRALDGYRLMQRLFYEQCRVENGEKIVVRDDVSGHSMQSPFDEDAGYSGHKGKGYQVQIVETCDPENDTQIITHAAVESAAESDADALVPAVEALDKRGHKPEEMIADTAYCGGTNDVALRDRGVTLTGPAAGRNPARESGLAGFETSPDLKQIIRCPLGVAPERTYYQKKKDTVTAVFNKQTCAACPLREECPVKHHKKGYTLTYKRSQMATAKRREIEKTENFKKTYSKRAAIEGTNSELKRAHGMGRLRVRGGPAVEYAVFMKITACNIKRYIKARIKLQQKAAGTQNPLANAASTLKKAVIAAIVPIFNLNHRRPCHSAPQAA